MTRIIVLLSGGLDSATALAIARSEGPECLLALTVDYGQRHRAELDAALRLANIYADEHEVVDLTDFGRLSASALTDKRIDVPRDRPDEEIRQGVPATYVPARNLVLLSVATAWAESRGVQEIYAGFNVLDASGYPDCRPGFVRAFQSAAEWACRDGRAPRVITPLISMTKAEIIRRGVELGLDYSLTHTCYDPVWRYEFVGRYLACGRCDSCKLRRDGFVEAGVSDPTRYA